MFKPNNYRRYYITIIIFIFISIITFIIMLSSPLNPLCKGVASKDSSVFQYVATVMARGGMPYKDTFDHKGPLVYIFNWMGNLIYDYGGVWFVEFLFMFVFLFAIYKIARLFCSELTSFFLVLVCVAPLYDYFGSGNYTEEYAMPFISIGIFIFIDYFINQRISRARLIICGACFGAVCMLRINMIAIWIVFSIAVLIKCILEKNKDWTTFLMWFLVGMAVVVLPLIIWLVINGSFIDFISDYIVFNLKYSASESNTVLSQVLSFSEFLQESVMLVALVILIYLISKQQEDRYFNCVYLVCLLVALIMAVMSGRFYGHYGMALIPLFIYPYARLYSNKSKDIISNTLILNILLTIMVFSPLLGLAQSAVAQFQNYLDHENNIPEDQQKVVDIITENTTEDDKIIVLGNRDVYYLLSHRLAASKYSYQTRADVDDSIREEILYDMETNCPLVVVMVGNYDQFFPNIEDYDMYYSFDQEMEKTDIVDGKLAEVIYNETTKVYLRKSGN